MCLLQVAVCFVLQFSCAGGLLYALTVFGACLTVCHLRLGLTILPCVKVWQLLCCVLHFFGLYEGVAVVSYSVLQLVCNTVTHRRAQTLTLLQSAQQRTQASVHN